MSSDLDVVRLVVAHVVERVGVLTRARVFIPVLLVLGAHHFSATLCVGEGREVLAIISGSRRIVVGLLLPYLSSLCLTDLHSGRLKLGGRFIDRILAWSRVLVNLRPVFRAHVGHTSGCLAEGVSLVDVVAWAWVVLFGLLGPNVGSLGLSKLDIDSLLLCGNSISAILARAWIQVLLWLVL